MCHETKIRVLIVDDYEIIRAALCAIINRQEDMQVCWEAANGKEAVDMFKQHQPDVVVMDVSMPIMSGMEATRCIRAEFPAACILALTAAASAEEIKTILLGGASACLSKESETAVIIEAIRSACITKNAVSAQGHFDGKVSGIDADSG